MEHMQNMEPEEKGQAGTNLAIVILVLVIVVVGVKLLMSSSPAGLPAAEEAVATSTEAEEATSPATSTANVMPPAGAGPAEDVAEAPAMPAQGAGAPVVAAGKGEVSFSVSSPTAVTVREIFVHNPYRVADANGGWIQVYDGYKPVAAGNTVNVFTVSLAAITYDEVKVRTLATDSGIPNEVVKTMQVEVVPGGKKDILIAL